MQDTDAQPQVEIMGYRGREVESAQILPIFCLHM
ncbi:hypothetical protein XaFJ1_GM002474 [Xanthomonas albilineans]|nr:hypothetical protein XaFJ1_GM002474 [Xanthomonas albilineans]